MSGRQKDGFKTIATSQQREHDGELEGQTFSQCNSTSSSGLARLANMK